MNNDELKQNTIKSRKCFYSNESKWHFFDHELKLDGEKCNCGETITKNGVVTKI